VSHIGAIGLCSSSIFPTGGPGLGISFSVGLSIVCTAVAAVAVVAVVAVVVLAALAELAVAFFAGKGAADAAAATDVRRSKLESPNMVTGQGNMYILFLYILINCIVY
jgi:hypothetical protein